MKLGPSFAVHAWPGVHRKATTRAAARVVARTPVTVSAALGLLGVLRALDAHRFRACASPTCSGVFVDTSRAGRRRYCMPDLCGNRANVAAHRARGRANQAAAGESTQTDGAAASRCAST